MTSSPPKSIHVEEERFRLLITGVTDYAIYMLSPEGIVSTWNAGAERFKGYKPHEIIGQHFSRFYTEEDCASGKPQRALETALRQGRYEDEGWRVRKDGTRFWTSVVIDTIRDDSGRLVGFAKITRDITDRKLAAEALRASEERFRLLVQGVTDYAIYMLSPEGEITNWNSGAMRIKGYGHDEVVGSHFSRFYTEEDRASGMPLRALSTAAANGRFEGEGWRVRKDGSRFWANVVIDPIRDDTGKLLGFAKITRDITEKRQAAQELERAKEALFQSQKLEAIGKLTGGVAHDFNNLLNVIVSGLGILDKEVSSPLGIKILDSMHRAAERGATLTHQLLTFARQQPLKQEKCKLNHVIGSFEAVLRRAGRASVGFDISTDRDLPPVMVDVPQFEAALLNLIVNANDATPDGGSIHLATGLVELGDEAGGLPAGRYVEVAVSDTGSGMPPEVAARAIEPFFTTKEVGKGTGMGLSQVYGFAQQSGGELRIDTRAGHGSRISILLPALDDKGDEVSGGPGQEDTEVALIVDDQPDVLLVAVEVFRSLGYQVLSANNGRDALDIIRRTPHIDVLFSDVVMPGMSGIDLARQAGDLVPGIKVLLASGYAAPALRSEHEDVDRFQLVTKPYRIAEIMKKLRAAG